MAEQGLKAGGGASGNPAIAGADERAQATHEAGSLLPTGSPATGHGHDEDSPGGHIHEVGPATGSEAARASAVQDHPPGGHTDAGHGAHAHGPHFFGTHGHDDHGHDDHGHEDHGHEGHGHAGHSHAVPTSLRAFAIGASLNFGFVIFEVVFGLLAGSLALLADAGHNLSDVLGLLLAWGAAWLSRRKPTDNRTFGYGRSSILAALANAIILLVGTGGIIVEAIARLSNPEPVETGIVMGVALLGVVVNIGTALLFLSGRKGDLNVRGAFVHMVADAAVSLGVVVAAGIIALSGWLWLDPVVSLVIAAVIVFGTWDLLRDSVNLALDAVPTQINRRAVEAYLAGRPGVTEVHDLHIWGLSTTEVALSAHLVRPGARLDDCFLVETSTELKSRFGISHPVLQVELGDMTCALAPKDVV